MKYRKLALFISIAVVVVAGSAIYKNNFSKAKTDDTQTVQKITGEALIEIDFGDKKESGIITLSKEVNALEALQNFSKEKGYELKVKQYDFGSFVEGIGGINGNTKKAWLYYVNDQSPEVGADKMILKDNDVLLWKHQEL